MQANQRKSLWAIRKHHVLKVCQSEHTVVRTVHSWSSTLTLSSPRNRVAEQGHWSECGRATSVADADVLGRPHRSVLSLGDHESFLVFHRLLKTLLGRGIIAEPMVELSA